MPAGAMRPGIGICGVSTICGLTGVLTMVMLVGHGQTNGMLCLRTEEEYVHSLRPIRKGRRQSEGGRGR